VSRARRWLWLALPTAGAAAVLAGPFALVDRRLLVPGLVAVAATAAVGTATGRLAMPGRCGSAALGALVALLSYPVTLLGLAVLVAVAGVDWPWDLRDVPGGSGVLLLWTGWFTVPVGAAAGVLAADRVRRAEPYPAAATVSRGPRGRSR
jgi:hypothetical protein